MMEDNRPDVDAIVDTFPIEEFARISKMSTEMVRMIARSAVCNAVDNDGHPYNVGKVMRYAIESVQR